MLSVDNGGKWRRAQLGRDLDKYSFREWSFIWTPPRVGNYRLAVRASNRFGTPLVICTTQRDILT